MKLIYTELKADDQLPPEDTTDDVKISNYSYFIFSVWFYVGTTELVLHRFISHYLGIIKLLQFTVPY